MRCSCPSSRSALRSKKSKDTRGDMARLLLLVNSLVLLLFGSDMFLVAASEYEPL